MERDIEKTEIDLLVFAVLARCGYDIREYVAASVRRRFRDFAADISQLIPMILHDRDMLNKLVAKMSITVTEMFRDPMFFRALREELIHRLKTSPVMRIWLAQCATGEEVHSSAIVLRKEGGDDCCRIYATDFNDAALAQTPEGIYPLRRTQGYASKYVVSGGEQTFSDYSHSEYESAIMDRSLKKNITFANHNLAAGVAFGEMDLISCWNLLIYFNQTLQGRALQFSTVADSFVPIADLIRIFKKVG